jgi:hypothetical protein
VLLAFLLPLPLPKQNKVELTAFQMQAITGLLLGDGCLINPNSSKRSTGNYRLEFKASTLSFVNWLKFDVLGNIS